MHEAEAMRLDIKKKLLEHGGDDLVIPYTHVSIAFPGKGFDCKRPDIRNIDKEALCRWAASRGWRVSFANDMSANDGFCPVRFTRPPYQVNA